MNKRLLLFHAAFLMAWLSWSQPLEAFNSQRLELNQKGMIVLGTWAIANMASSPVLASRAEGSRKYFHQMNGFWNTVNLTLAGIGYYTSATTDPALLTLGESIKAQHAMEKILLLNAGLDLAYMIGGLYLQQRAKRSANHGDRLKGFGQSLVWQGGFLLLFDVGFYLLQSNHGKQILNFVDQLAIGPAGLRFTFYL